MTNTSEPTHPRGRVLTGGGPAPLRDAQVSPIAAGARSLALRTAWSALWGFTLAFWFFGYATLDPTHFDWLLIGDGGQHYTARQLWLDQPWDWPPFQMVRMGHPEPVSFFYFDGNPLLASLLKLSGIAHEGRQYVGVWVALCLTLSVFFGSLLLQNLGVGRGRALVGAVPFAMFAPMLLRIDHDTLMAHFTLLATLAALTWRGRAPEACILAASTVAVVTLAIHPYLAAMCGMLVLVRAFADGRRALRPVYLLALAVLPVGGLLLTMILAPDAGDYVRGRHRYGYWSMNLLAPVNPMGGSSFLPRTEVEEGQYEGYQYPGMGLWLLTLAAATAFLVRRSLPVSRRTATITAAFVALVTMFAVSHQVELGTLRLFTLPAPQALLDRLVTFQASGRFFWIVWYLVIALAVWRLATLLPRLAFGALIATVVVLQAADLGPIRNMLLRRAWVEVDTEWAMPLPDGIEVYVLDQGMKRIERGEGFPALLQIVRAGKTVANPYLARDHVANTAWAERIIVRSRHGPLPAGVGYAMLASDVPPNAEALGHRVFQRDGVAVIAGPPARKEAD